jgi:hypothetical protein
MSANMPTLRPWLLVDRRRLCHRGAGSYASADTRSGLADAGSDDSSPAWTKSSAFLVEGARAKLMESGRRCGHGEVRGARHGRRWKAASARRERERVRCGRAGEALVERGVIKTKSEGYFARSLARLIFRIGGSTNF